MYLMSDATNISRNDITATLTDLGVDWTSDEARTSAGERPIRVADDALLIYWDDQDPGCQGWAWRLRTGDDVTSGALDDLEELRELVGLVAPTVCTCAHHGEKIASVVTAEGISHHCEECGEEVAA